ncbi:unnamed protein product [Amoebophrya sp. A25]|nr:unnamed protein product [Amoebophrya sp. A25]|eukprot:GSA25T00013875001.1
MVASAAAVSTSSTAAAFSTMSSSAKIVQRGFVNRIARGVGLPKTLLDGVDGFVFDCDGVIWRAGELCDPRIPGVFKQLRALKKRVFFVTNNSTKPRSVFLEKLKSLGIDAEPNELYSAAFACAEYLRLYQPRLLSTHAVYLIGMSGLEQELRQEGINVFGGPSDTAFNERMQKWMSEKVTAAGEKGIFGVFENIPIPGAKSEAGMTNNAGTSIEKPIGAVVCGFDPTLNYYKVQLAQLCLNEKYNPVKDCAFIATNPDAVAHITPDCEWAGNGWCVGAIKGCTNREPVYTGKPSSLLMDILCKGHGLDRQRLVMIGDRLDTDILFGLSNRMKTLLVLSGVTTEAEGSESETRADYCIDNVGEFFESGTAQEA